MGTKSFIELFTNESITSENYFEKSYSEETHKLFEKKSSFTISKLVKIYSKIVQEKRFPSDNFLPRMLRFLGAVRSQISAEENKLNLFGFLRSRNEQFVYFTPINASNVDYFKNYKRLLDENWIDLNFLQKLDSGFLFENKVKLGKDDLILAKVRFSDSFPFRKTFTEEAKLDFFDLRKNSQNKNEFSLFEEDEIELVDLHFIFILHPARSIQSWEKIESFLEESILNLLLKEEAPEKKLEKISDIFWYLTNGYFFYRGSASVNNWILNSLLYFFNGIPNGKDSNNMDRLVSDTILDIAPFFMNKESFKEFFKKIISSLL